MIQHITLEFMQILVDMGTVVIERQTLGSGHQVIVRQTFLLGNEGDDVLTETIHAHIQPELQDLLDLFTNQRIVHIQVGLLDGEDVQIIFLTDFVPCPCLAFEHGIPVVGQTAVFFGRAPDVIIGVRIDPLAALLEPFMLVTGVVDHQIHQHLHATRMSAVQHLTECLHAAEFRRNVHIVRDIIAAVSAGGRVDGGEPDAVHTQLLQIIQLLIDTQQVAHAVAIAVLERTGPDLVEYLVLVPASSFHNYRSFFGFSYHTIFFLIRHLKSR